MDSFLLPGINGLDGFSLALLLLLACFAGFVDAIVGGGGLIQVPAIFTLIPQGTPATLLGTTKVASLCGTSVASFRYARHVPLPWRMLAWAVPSTLVCAFLGARTVSLLPKEWMRPLVLVLLVLVACVTVSRKDFGRHHLPRHQGRAEIVWGMLTGGALGFYDGFFGPGMGTFLIFCFVHFFGYDFLQASATSKILNLASNLAALTYFAPTGHVIWSIALAMAAANVSGSWIGSHVALRGQPHWIRGLFLLVLCALIAKLSWDTVGLQVQNFLGI